MIKRFHEAPKTLFKEVQLFTNGDYALVHLFEKDMEYFNLFKEAVENGREVILDNSIFELGKAFDPERFVYWINRLNPEWYIVPDVLEDADGTIKNMEDWETNWKPKITVSSKEICVVQGKTYEDLVRCYKAADRYGDKIAISFDYSYYEKSFPHTNILVSWAMGRVQLLGKMLSEGIINLNKPHHLLGCAIPGEGIFYESDGYRWIDSVDTSNPVAHGLYEIRYDCPVGLSRKIRDKMCDMMDLNVDAESRAAVYSNIRKFECLWNGKYGKC